MIAAQIMNEIAISWEMKGKITDALQLIEE